MPADEAAALDAARVAYDSQHSSNTANMRLDAQGRALKRVEHKVEEIGNGKDEEGSPSKKSKPNNAAPPAGSSSSSSGAAGVDENKNDKGEGEEKKDEGDNDKKEGEGENERKIRYSDI